jgi:3'-5' exoribonuclease
MTRTEALANLRSLGVNICSNQQWQMCIPVLNDPKFWDGLASASHHPDSHQQPGGLVIHTFEVAQLAVEMCGLDTHLAQLAYIAAVYHDYFKFLDYEWNPETNKASYTEFTKRVGHVVAGWRFFMDVAENHQFDLTDTEEVGHALLAHHGRREWGSPVEPQSKLAYILHTADMLSSRGVVKL